MALGLGIAMLVPPTASANPGDVWVADLARPAGPGHLIQVDPSSGAELREVVPAGPGVEPLHVPVGIAIDAQGFLIVTDTDGYNTTAAYPGGGFDNCNNTGCGAVLRVNPESGAATVISKGPHWYNPSGVLLPEDGDLFDDGGGVGDRLLVTDTGSRGILAVDPHLPPDANQTFLYENFSAVAPPVPVGERRGLRNPWDIARDPDTGDLLITNYGVRDTPSEPLEGVVGCDDDGDPSNGLSESDGYVARMAPATGQITGYVCSPDFRKPRGIVAAGGGRIFVADPFANTGSEFAALFQITGGQVETLSLGGQLLAPSGLSFSYEGDNLLVADESAFPPATGDCVGAGCGGVLALNALSGDQAAFARRGPLGLFRDPIDVAVDRAGAPKPLSGKPLRKPCKPKRCCPKRQSKCKKVVDFVQFFNVREGRRRPPIGIGEHPGGIEVLLLDGFGERAKVRFQCLAGQCPVQRDSKNAVGGKVAFDFGSQELEGSFRITAFVPIGGKRRNIKTVFIGRYQDFVFTGGPGAGVDRKDGGCLRPGESTVRVKKPRTTTKCPVANGH
jgi:DNA-binding beta-propeller fold protein YncE